MCFWNLIIDLEISIWEIQIEERVELKRAVEGYRMGSTEYPRINPAQQLLLSVLALLCLIMQLCNWARCNWATPAMHHAYLDETLWVKNVEACLYSEIKFINLNDQVKHAICTKAAQIALFFWRANSLAIMYISAACKVTCICSQQDLPGWSTGVLRKPVLY